MITIFNRKELIMTYDMKIQSDVSNILASNNVDYFIKVSNVYSVTSDLRSYEYKIYVPSELSITNKKEAFMPL